MITGNEFECDDLYAIGQPSADIDQNLCQGICC